MKATQGDKPMEMPAMMSMDDKTMPDMKNWQVGKKYKMMMDVEQMGMRKDMDGKMHGEFKILKAKEYKKTPGTYSEEVINKFNNKWGNSVKGH